ncbi:hypothetical protein [uncultured Hyphomicrobium sp.]|uniref:hypothetical protein n=1 Tax=uncultured Hyphomicrobium sp. TaxID=194373 RepID=UPI0025E36280|nr:hypothetical protein [uncultured Hyphomicrobium sp.]
MQSPVIVLAALLPISIGAMVLIYQHTGVRRFDTLLSFFGVALVASGLAMARDGVEGTRRILWMLPSDAAAVTAQDGMTSVATAPALRAVAVRD